MKRTRKKTTTHKSTRKVKRKRFDKNTATYVYVLLSTPTGKTYIGVTNNLERRLKQHNGIAKGGARYTSNYSPWTFNAVFLLKNRHDALSLEWKAKHRVSSNDGPGIQGKINRIIRLSSQYTGVTRYL